MYEGSFFADVLLKVALMIIMAGMGLTLTFQDFRNVIVFPKGILLGLLSQMVFLPLVAFLVAWMAPIAPEYKVGLMLVGICPGGATSNLVNFMLRGNLALSVSLAAVNSFITQFSIPALLNLSLLFFMGSGQEIALPFWEMMWEIFLVTLLPVLVGMLFRHYFPVTTEKLRKLLKYVMPSLLAVAMIGAIFLDEKSVYIESADYFRVFPWLLVMNVFSMFAGFGFGRLLKMKTANAMTIAVETGLQNTGLALAIALGSNMLNNPAMAVPASVYALFSFFTTLLIGWWFNRKNVSISEVIRRRP